MSDNYSLASFSTDLSKEYNEKKLQIFFDKLKNSLINTFEEIKKNGDTEKKLEKFNTIKNAFEFIEKYELKNQYPETIKNLLDLKKQMQI